MEEGHKPTGSDTVGFVLELFWEDLTELLEKLVLDDAAVDGCNSVYVAAVYESEVCHVDEDLLLIPLVGLDDAHALHLGLEVLCASKLFSQELIPAHIPQFLGI
jgi:hypothetical protein